MERIAAPTVTECLARAMENADKMKNVIVLYESCEGDPSPGGIMMNDDATLAMMNYLLDLAKSWIFS